MRLFVRPLAGLLLSVLLGAPLAAQTWGEISGRVLEDGGPIAGASVLVEGTSFGTNTGADGRYAFRIPEGRYAVRVSFVGYTTVRDTVVVRRGEETRFDAVLEVALGDLGDVEVTAGAERGVGISRIDPTVVRDMPLPVQDAIRTVKTELGVTSSNELSNSFSVRGGSYDENQFFIDGFEIYRPLRIRQGEQEGLGLINGDLTSRMTLFAGGFPVRYGGKLASVLDATYSAPEGTPTSTAYLSTLDAGVAVSGALTDRIGLAIAARSARPQRFFASQELEGSYDPNFRDLQGVLDAHIGGSSLRAVGLYARHRFRLAPQQQETTFGIYPNLIRTVARDFSGLEEDGYDIAFGGLLLRTPLGTNASMEHRVSTFTTDEFETIDISSRSSLFRRQQRPGGSQTDLDRLLEGQTVQSSVTDNSISQTVVTAEGRYLSRLGRHSLEAGWSGRRFAFDDTINEKTDFTGRSDDGDVLTITASALVADTSFASWLDLRLGRGRHLGRRTTDADARLARRLLLVQRRTHAVAAPGRCVHRLAANVVLRRRRRVSPGADVPRASRRPGAGRQRLPHPRRRHLEPTRSTGGRRPRPLLYQSSPRPPCGGLRETVHGPHLLRCRERARGLLRRERL